MTTDNTKLPSVRAEAPTALAVHDYDSERLELLRTHVAQGCTDAELAYFVEVANSVGLNPLRREIYAIKRWDSKLGREKMTIQTGIDGYRKIAHLTGDCTGISAPEYSEVSMYGGGMDLACRVTVLKRVHGTDCAFPAEARMSEYQQCTKDGQVMHMWASKPMLMLAKCAESLALRKAFPNELSGVYTRDEMGTGEVVDVSPGPPPAPSQPPTTPPPNDVRSQLQRLWHARLGQLVRDGRVPFVTGPKGGRTMDDGDRHVVQRSLWGHDSLSQLSPPDCQDHLERLRATSDDQLAQHINRILQEGHH